MLKALLKKQFLELGAFYFQNKKSGARRSVGSIIVYALVLLIVFLLLGVALASMAYVMAKGLLPQGEDWLYFAFMSITTIAIGVFGSVFSTYASLYQAKDNEMLLSMPIPPWMILLTRMSGVFVTSLLFSAVAWIPTMVVYWVMGHAGAVIVISCVFLTFVITLLVSVLTCAIGWIVALISIRLKNKSYITVVLSLGLVGLYFLYINKYNEWIQAMIANGDAIGKSIKIWMYPLYQLGLAASGNLLSLLIVTVMVGALFALCLWVLGRTFGRITTGGRQSTHHRYTTGDIRKSNVGQALFRRELKRFVSSSTYMLNCGMGLIMMLVVAVLALIKMEWIGQMMELALALSADVAQMIPVLAVAIVFLMISINGISAPSVSLEGKNIWILQSMPVDPKKILTAKIKLHVLLNSIPALICTLVLGILTKASIPVMLLMVITVCCYVVLTGMWGITLDLKKPNLTWVNETVPVKQGFSVGMALFSGIGFSVLFAGLAILLSALRAWLYLLIMIVLLVALIGFLYRWLVKKGTAIFRTL